MTFNKNHAQIELSDSQVVQKYNKNHKNALQDAIGVSIFLFVIILALNQFIRANYNGFIFDIVTLILDSMQVGIFVIGFLIYKSDVETKGILVWLRRFKPGYGKKIRIHRIVTQACAAIVFPITIQDSSFRSSHYYSIQRLWLHVPFIILLYALGMLFIMYFLIPLDVKPSKNTLSILLGVYSVLFVLIIYKVTQRFGFKNYTSEIWIDKLKSRFDSLQHGRKGLGYGVEIYRCSDHIWKDVVHNAISKAEIALIDISEITDHLLWEILQAFKLLPKEKILLVCGASTPETEQNLLKVAQYLEMHEVYVDLDWVKNSIVTYFGTEMPSYTRRKLQYKYITARFRLEIAKRIQMQATEVVASQNKTNGY